MRKRFLFIMLVIFFVSVLVAAKNEKNSKTKELRKCPRRVKVLVQKVVQGNFNEYTNVEKKILPSKEVYVLSKISGIIKSIEKKAGDEVKAGDIILVFNVERHKKELEAETKNLAKWKKKLFNRQHWKVKSPRAEKQAERELEKSLSKIADLNKIINNSVQTSEIDGIVGRVKVNTGDLISANFEICKILVMEEVKVDISEYAKNVSEAQKFNILIKELSKNFEASVFKPKEEKVYLRIKNIDNEITTDMTAKFSILTKNYPNAISIPNSLIQNENSISFLYTVNKKRAIKTILETGQTDKTGLTHILRGLHANDYIIVSEVLSAKKGKITNSLRCISNDKKIKVMVLNKATGKYIKKKHFKTSVKTTIARIKKNTSVDETKKNSPEKNNESLKTKNLEKEKKYAEEKAKISEEKKRLAREKAERKKIAKKRKDIENKERKLKLKALIDKKSLLEKQKSELRKKIVLLEKEIYALDKKTFFGRTSLGLTLSYNKMSLSNFEDIYGRIINPGIELTYEISRKLDLWLNIAYSSKTASLEWSTEDAKFSYIPINFDLRYKFAKSNKFVFLAGAGINYYSFEDINPIETLKDNIIGFNLLTGTRYAISKKVSFDVLFKMNFVKKNIENSELTPDNPMDLSGMELVVGFSFILGK